MHLKLFDVVALLRDFPEKNLQKGSVGTIVDMPASGVCIIEFVDNEGYTYALETLQMVDLMLLQFQAIAA